MVDQASTERTEHASDNVAASFPARRASSNLQLAFEAMFPRRDYTAPKRFLGRHKAVLDLLGNRTSMGTIEQWLNGRRPTPRWVRKIVHAELLHQAHVLLDAAAEIEAQEDKPRQYNITLYWQKKRAAEHAARSQAVRGD